MELTQDHSTVFGLLPSDWATPPIETLGDGVIPAVKAGPFGSALTKDQYVTVGFKVYGQEQVIRGDHTYGDYFISGKKYRELESCAVRTGDILLSLVGTVGRLLVIPEGAQPGVINPRLIRFSLNKRSVDSAFFRYFFESTANQRRLDQLAQGGTMGVLNAGALRSFRIPLPKIEEQRAIASVLSDVDTLIAGLEQLIGKKRDIKLAAMQQLLTGQTRLPGFSGEWEPKLLGEHLTFLKNGVNSRAELDEAGSIKYLHYGDIHGSKGVFVHPETTMMPFLSAPKASKLDRLANGDLVFADASEDLDGIGKAVEVKGMTECELVSGLHTIAARFDKNVLADGFKAYLQFVPSFRAHLKRLAAGTKVYATNRAHIASVKLGLPDVKEQTAIAAVLSDMDADLSAIESRLAKTRFLKQGLMQELLSGRTRLI